MQGYRDSSYGDAFADVYDDWYADVSDVDVTADLVAELAAGSVGTEPRPGRVLELGIGTGRLAVPLAERGLIVHGVDASDAMLARLRARDTGGRVVATIGDMAAGLPDGPFDVALVAYNTLFNLPTAERQQACFAEVAARLRAPAGAFVVEAFVPDDPPRAGHHVAVRSMTAAAVVLEVTVHDPATQRAEGQFVELADGAPVRLRPWSIRYAPPSELDAMADAAGLALAARWGDADRRPFGPDSERHISVYRRHPTAPR